MTSTISPSSSATGNAIPSSSIGPRRRSQGQAHRRRRRHRGVVTSVCAHQRARGDGYRGCSEGVLLPRPSSALREIHGVSSPVTPRSSAARGKELCRPRLPDKDFAPARHSVSAPRDHRWRPLAGVTFFRTVPVTHSITWFPVAARSGSPTRFTLLGEGARVVIRVTLAGTGVGTA